MAAGTTTRDLRVVAAPAAPDYRALVEAAGDIIYTLDCAGRFTFVNRALGGVLGYSPGQVIGRPFLEFLTPASAHVALRHFADGVKGLEETPFFEVEALHEEGRVVHLEVRASSLYRDAILVGRQGIARDIGELKTLQASLSRRTALFEERMRTALSLYARIADLALAAPEADPSGGPALVQVHEAVTRACAEKVGLTPSDLGILELLARGRSNREIAGAIGLSPHTVKDHVARILQRLGARRRAQAVAAAHRLGLIPDTR